MPQGDKNKKSKSKSSFSVSSLWNSTLNIFGLGKSEEELQKEEDAKETQRRLDLQNEDLKRQAEELKKLKEQQKAEEEKKKASSKKELDEDDKEQDKDDKEEEKDDIAKQKAKELGEKVKKALEQELADDDNKKDLFDLSDNERLEADEKLNEKLQNLDDNLLNPDEENIIVEDDAKSTDVVIDGNKGSINDTESDVSNGGKGKLIDGKVEVDGNTVTVTKVYSTSKRKPGDPNPYDFEEHEREENRIDEERGNIDIEDELSAKKEDVKKSNSDNNSDNSSSSNNSNSEKDESKLEDKKIVKDEKAKLLEELENAEKEVEEEDAEREDQEVEENLEATSEDIKSTNEKIDKELGENEQEFDLEEKDISEVELDNKIEPENKEEKKDEQKEPEKEEKKVEEPKKEETEKKVVPDATNGTTKKLLPRAERNQLFDMIEAINANNGTQFSTNKTISFLNNQFRAGAGDNLTEQRETFKKSYKDFMAKAYNQMLEDRNKLDPSKRPSLEEMTNDFNKFAKQVANVSKSRGWMEKDYEIGPNGGLSAEQIKGMQEKALGTLPQTSKQYVDSKVNNPKSKDPDKDIQNFGNEINKDLEGVEKVKPGEEPSKEAKNALMKLNALNAVHEGRSRGWKLRHPIANRREENLIANGQKALEAKGYDKDVVNFMIHDKDLSNTDIMAQDVEKNKKEIEKQYEKNNKAQRAFENKQEQIEKELAKKAKEMKKQISVNEASNPEKVEKKEEPLKENQELDLSSKDISGEELDDKLEKIDNKEPVKSEENKEPAKEGKKKEVPEPTNPREKDLLPKAETNQLFDMVEAINAKIGTEMGTKGITKYLNNQFKAGKGETLKDQRETFKQSYADFMKKSYQVMLESRGKMDPTNRPSLEEMTNDFNKYAQQIANVAKANGWMKKDYEIGPNGGLSAESIRKMQKDSVEKASQNTKEFYEKQLEAKDSKEPDKAIESFEMKYNSDLIELQNKKEGEEPSVEAKNAVTKLQALNNVHASRSRGWKMRHPFANSREKKLLENAQKILNEKGYTKEVLDKMMKDPKSNEKDIVQEGINQDKKDIEQNYEKNRKAAREFEENQERMEHEIQKQIKGIRKQISVPEAADNLTELQKPQNPSPAVQLQVQQQKQIEVPNSNTGSK